MKRNISIYHLLVAVAVMMHVWIYAMSIHRHAWLANDSIQYLTLADNLADNGVWSQAYQAPFVPDVQRTPGYPVLLILLGRIPWLILLVQHLMVIATAWILFKLLSSTFSNNASKWAALIWMLQPYPVLFGSVILSETSFIFFMMLALWGINEWRLKGQLMALASGLAMLVIAIYIRPVAYPLLLLIFPWLIFHSFRKFRKRLIPAVVVYLLLASLCLPWMIRNYHLTGRPTLSVMDQMGMIHGRLGGLESMRRSEPMDEHHLFMAGDSITAITTGLPAVRKSYTTVMNHEAELYPANVGAITRAFFLDHPGDAIVFQLKCTWQMLSGVGKGWGRLIIGEGPLHIVLAILQALMNLLMYTCLLLSFLRMKKWPGLLWICLIICGILLFLSAAAWADGRYRMVIDPILLAFTAFNAGKQSLTA